MKKFPNKNSEEDFQEYAQETIKKLNRSAFEKGKKEAEGFATGFVNGYNIFTSLFVPFFVIAAIIFIINLIIYLIFSIYINDLIFIALVFFLYGCYFTFSYLPRFKENLAKEVYRKYIRSSIVKKHVYEEVKNNYMDSAKSDLKIDYKALCEIEDLTYYYEKYANDSIEAIDGKLFFDDHFIRC